MRRVEHLMLHVECRDPHLLPALRLLGFKMDFSCQDGSRAFRLVFEFRFFRDPDIVFVFIFRLLFMFMPCQSRVSRTESAFC